MKAVFLLALTWFSLSAFAGPIESVTATVDQLMRTLQSPNDRQRISGLCQLVRTSVDNVNIGNILLGEYGNISRDSQGIRLFKALVPSIIVDEFYDLLADKANRPYQIGKNTLPKGSGKVGVVVTFGASRFVVTVTQAAPNKVLDVEYGSNSLVMHKRGDFKRKLLANYTVNPESSLPVSELVKELERDGVNKCN